jgi:hypothetical protein
MMPEASKPDSRSDTDDIFDPCGVAQNISYSFLIRYDPFGITKQKGAWLRHPFF